MIRSSHGHSHFLKKLMVDAPCPHKAISLLRTPNLCAPDAALVALAVSSKKSKKKGKDEKKGEKGNGEPLGSNQRL